MTLNKKKRFSFSYADFQKKQKQKQKQKLLRQTRSCNVGHFIILFFFF
jgi:hypothetical protein